MLLQLQDASLQPKRLEDLAVGNCMMMFRLTGYVNCFQWLSVVTLVKLVTYVTLNVYHSVQTHDTPSFTAA